MGLSSKYRESIGLLGPQPHSFFISVDVNGRDNDANPVEPYLKCSRRVACLTRRCRTSPKGCRAAEVSRQSEAHPAPPRNAVSCVQAMAAQYHIYSAFYRGALQELARLIDLDASIVHRDQTSGFRQKAGQHLPIRLTSEHRSPGIVHRNRGRLRTAQPRSHSTKIWKKHRCQGSIQHATPTRSGVF
jgi:hypothetical protein